MANQVLDVVEEFSTKKVFANAAVSKPRDVEPQVFEVVNRPELGKFLNAEGVQLSGWIGRITGSTVCASESPGRWELMVYVSLARRYLDIPQPRSVHAVLGTLTKILGIKVELSGLERQAEEMDRS